MRTTVTLVLLLTGVIGSWPSAALGDTWLPPTPRIFASSDGAFGFKVIPYQPKEGQPLDQVQSAATLFTLDAKGAEQVMWHGDLVNIPHLVFVSFTGQVATVDTYARLGYEHSLVVYSLNGKVLADYKLEDLLTAEEIAANVPVSVGSRWWAPEAAFDYSPDGRSLGIKLNWGKVIIVNLNTGEISR